MLYQKTSPQPIDVVVASLQTAAAAEQFGVLGIHDLKQKMESKGVAFGPECRVLEVCNPQKAKIVLESDLSIANALPCRIAVYQEGDRTCVSMLKPSMLLGMFNRPELQPVAEEVEVSMIRIIDAACD